MFVLVHVLWFRSFEIWISEFNDRTFEAGDENISDFTSEEVKSKVYKALYSLSPHDDQCILVQFWAANKAGRAHILATPYQPFGVYGSDRGIDVYREGCLQHKLFVDHEKNASFGLVGLVFLEKTRQQTRDMNPYYPPDQRPKFEAEIFPLIWRNFAVPVFFDNKCQGVLEFVTTKSLSSYEGDMDLVENALQIAGLQSLSEIDIPIEITSSVKKRRKTLKTEYNKYNDIASFFGLPKEEALEVLNRKINKRKKIKKSTFNSVLRTIGVTVWPCIPKKTSKASASAPETLVNLTSPEIATGLVPDQNDQHDTNERQPELANDLLQNQYDDVLVNDHHVLPNPVGPLNETTWDANARDTIVNPTSLEFATRIVPAQNDQHELVTNDRQPELDNNLLKNQYANVVVNDHHVMSDLVGQFYETPWDAVQDPSTCHDYSLLDFNNLDQLSGDFNDEEFFNDRLWS